MSELTQMESWGKIVQNEIKNIFIRVCIKIFTSMAGKEADKQQVPQMTKI